MADESLEVLLYLYNSLENFGHKFAETVMVAVSEKTECQTGVNQLLHLGGGGGGGGRVKAV
jgi:hypothetical protein